MDVRITEFANPVQGIVLAGVHAWGESALEQMCPRPLLPVVGRPLVWYVLDWLERSGIRQVSICANSDTNRFRECLGNGTLQNLQLQYYADFMPRGPAGCVKDAAAAFADTLVVVEASVAVHIDLAALLEAHRHAQAALTVVVTQAASAAAEPVGVYVLSRSALACIPAKGYQDIKEMLIPRLHSQGQVVVAYPVDGRQNLRVRDAASYLAAGSWALEGPAPAWVAPGGYRQIGQAYVHETAHLADTARLVGPVVVGPRCQIEQGATIVGSSSLGSDCRIGADAVVSRSALWTGCQVQAGAIVDHCVLLAGAIVESAGVMRDTVCLPQDAASAADMQQSYWALPPQRRTAPNLLEMLLTTGSIHSLPDPSGSPRMLTKTQ